MVVTKYAWLFLACVVISMCICENTDQPAILQKYKIPDKGQKFKIRVKEGTYFNVILKYPTQGYKWKVMNFKTIKTWIASLNLDVNGFCQDHIVGFPGMPMQPGHGGYYICKFRAVKKNKYPVPMLFQMMRMWESKIENEVNLRVIIN